MRWREGTPVEAVDCRKALRNWPPGYMYTVDTWGVVYSNTLALYLSSHRIGSWRLKHARTLLQLGFLTDKPMRLLAHMSAVDCVGRTVALPRKPSASQGWFMGLCKKNQQVDLCLSQQQGIVMKRWGGGREAGKERKSTDSRCQTKTWVTQTQGGNPSLTPQPQDRSTHVGSTHTIILCTEYICAYMYITYL